MPTSILPFQTSRQRVGANVVDIAMLAGIGLGVYWLYTKFFAGGGASQAQTQIANTNQTAAQASTQQATQQGIVATLTPNSMASLANSIYNAGINATSPGDLGGINSLIDQVNNLADLNGIISAFGTKKIPTGDITAWYNTCLSLGINCAAVGLGDFVRTVYGTYDPGGSYLSTINEFLQNMNINYQF